MSGRVHRLIIRVISYLGSDAKPLCPFPDRRLSVSERVRTLILTAFVGAFLGATAVTAAYVVRPTLALEMDRSLPRRFAAGLYDSERAGQTTFAWTSQRVDIKLTGVTRRVTWTCSVRFRGGRSDPGTEPSVALAADGLVTTTATATNDFQDATIVLPPRASSGAVVTITSSSTLVPGPSDPRQLGVQIDRMTCAASKGIAWPPSATIRDAALAAAILGAAFALLGLRLRIALSAVTVIAVLQALPLASGPAPYIPFSTAMIWYALWIGIAAVVLVAAVDRVRPPALHQPARVAIVVSGGVLYLKLLGLLHPSKLVIDAVFHAHRFEWVMAGKYYFTQPMPDGVTFPYAIGLYVFAAPWSTFTDDYVALLKVVVCSAQAVAGTLLYPVIRKAWNDPVAAVTAVVLFNVVPLPFGLLGNANLTNMFGEAVALATVLTASLVPGARPLPLMVFFLVSALAFLSHVSTFALLGVTLAALAAGYRMFGGPALRSTAWSIGLVTIASAILAVVLYYGHFEEVYKKALRVRADATAAQSQAQPEATAVPPATPSPSLGARIANAIQSAIGTIGWPIMLLGIAGLWRSVVDRSTDRATLAAMAWAVAGLVFLGVAVMRVDAPFQRYAAEFFGRVLLATSPAAVVLAARGTGWAWNQGLTLRLGSASLVAWALVSGIQNWISWFA
jgi:hypothetical protein